MRCPDCNKFVSFEAAEPEMDVNINNGEIVGTVQITLNCAECGLGLKGYTFDVSEQLELPDHKCKIEGKEEDPEYDTEGLDVENADRTEGKGRWMKTFYGYVIEGEVVCQCRESRIKVEIKDDVQASAMDEMV